MPTFEDDGRWFAPGQGPDTRTRPLSPEELEVVARLASQYSDLHLVELDLHELARLRGHGTGPATGPRYRPAELLGRQQSEPHASITIGRALGLEGTSTTPASEASGPGPAERWTAEWCLRLVWSFLWRWGGLAASMVLLPSVAEIRAAQGTRLAVLLGGAASILALVFLGLMGRWWRRAGLSGSLFRLLLGAVLVNLAFFLSSGAVFLAFLAALIVMTGDALASFFVWPRSARPEVPYIRG